MAIHVELLAYTEGCETIIAAAAKLCYSSAGISEILQGLTPEKTESFLKRLADMGHESPLEHLSFTFGIEGVSRSLLAQITRHRIASYSVKSQRYVREGAFSYVTPPSISRNEKVLALYQKAMADCQDMYDKLVAALEEQNAEDLMQNGMPEKEARQKAGKMANEDARFVLPNACETKIVMTMNARSLLNFFAERCCNRAQWEIHDLADQMLALVRQKAPTIFAYAGPPCVKGACPEGKMSCGQLKKVREKYLEK